MCGIVGYIGHREAQPILLQSLKRLEYRGYDSCGIAASSEMLSLYKNVGRVVDLEKAIPRMRGRMGIGHTRWATHGAVTAANAHPHADCTGRIAVVHNGVIENFRELRDQLTQEGHRFLSETDTEVIAHLIEKHYHGDALDAVRRALAEVSGTYALAILVNGHAEVIAARRESPLIVGIGDKENFVASDVAAVLDYTDRVIYLEDGDIVTVSPETVNIINGGRRVTRREERVPWTIEDAQKAGYEHFMLKEIHEQPRTIEATLRGYVPFVRPLTILGSEGERPIREITLVACGTSYHAALLGEYIFGRICHLPARAKMASEFDPQHMALENSWVLGITQSGETADTLRALQRAKALGCPTIGITNVPGSSITRMVGQVLYTQSGPEIGVAATKTFLAQLTTLYLLALSFSQLDARTVERLTAEMRMLPAMVQQVLEDEELIAEHARTLARYEHVFYVGRGISYPVALEGALKLKEISYIHAEAYPAGEIKHGPFALLRPNTPVVAVVPQDDTYEPMLTSVKEIEARGPQVIALATEGDETIQQVAHIVIRVPRLDPLLSPFVNTVVLQLLAYYAARERGCPIDLPANLAKSVTVP